MKPKIVYKEIIPQSEDFALLYKSTGWDIDDAKEKDFLFNAINNSWYTISAYDGDNLIGFGRVISDGYLHAFIADLIVSPNYQGKGIGKNILQYLVDYTQKKGIFDIQLFCAQGKKEFYLKNNFVERSEGAPGMQFNN